jgi:methylmalonyl-CoA/ethylmalonyl-CoA epimerase
MPTWNPNSIAALHSNNASERSAAAREIFASGHARAISATQAWFQNQELRQLLCETGSDQPSVTVGVAVHPETFAKIHSANGSPQLAAVPPDQDAREFELHFGGDIELDILTTRDPNGDGAIARFLSKQGEGMQQVEFRCTDVDRATAILQEQLALAPVYPQPRPGANHTRINFFLVAASDGKKILIELYESA